MRFRDIPQFPSARYEVNVAWDYLEQWLADHNRDTLYNLDLDPDFQRAHVWTSAQRTAYVEFMLRGGEGGNTLYFNHPNWMGSFRGSLTLVDGKQRLEAARGFLRDEVPVFGGACFSDFTDSLGWAFGFKVRVAKLQTRADMLRWYLGINAGGTSHTRTELNRVRALLAAEEATTRAAG